MRYGSKFEIILGFLEAALQGSMLHSALQLQFGHHCPKQYGGVVLLCWGKANVSSSHTSIHLEELTKPNLMFRTALKTDMFGC